MLLVALLLPAHRADAQIPVTDVASFGQAVTSYVKQVADQVQTMAKWATQYTQMATQITNQVQQIENQVIALERMGNPAALLNATGINELISQTQSLVSEFEHIADPFLDIVDDVKSLEYTLHGTIDSVNSTIQGLNPANYRMFGGLERSYEGFLESAKKTRTNMANSVRGIERMTTAIDAATSDAEVAKATAGLMANGFNMQATALQHQARYQDLHGAYIISETERQKWIQVDMDRRIRDANPDVYGTVEGPPGGAAGGGPNTPDMGGNPDSNNGATNNADQPFDSRTLPDGYSIEAGGRIVDAQGNPAGSIIGSGSGSLDTDGTRFAGGDATGRSSISWRVNGHNAMDGSVTPGVALNNAQVAAIKAQPGYENFQIGDQIGVMYNGKATLAYYYDRSEDPQNHANAGLGHTEISAKTADNLGIKCASNGSSMANKGNITFFAPTKGSSVAVK